MELGTYTYSYYQFLWSVMFDSQQMDWLTIVLVLDRTRLYAFSEAGEDSYSV